VSAVDRFDGRHLCLHGDEARQRLLILLIERPDQHPGDVFRGALTGKLRGILEGGR